MQKGVMRKKGNFCLSGPEKKQTICTLDGKKVDKGRAGGAQTRRETLEGETGESDIRKYSRRSKESLRIWMQGARRTSPAGKQLQEKRGHGERHQGAGVCHQGQGVGKPTMAPTDVKAINKVNKFLRARKEKEDF